jgi:3-oxoadipate enol-lactonase
MKTFDADDGATIEYQSDGNADAPALLFLNGMTQTIRHWSRQAKHFESEYRVLRYNARGQGGSTLGDDEVSLERHTQDVAGLLDHLDIDRCHFAGFSHGARIACHTAARQPGLVDRLVLCSATATDNALARTTVRAWRQTLEAGGLEAMSWASLPTILGNDFLEQSEEMIEGIIRASVRRNSEEGVRALLDGLESYDPLGAFASDVEAPTLVISADEDMLVTREGAAKLAELTGGQHDHVTGVGHTVPIEDPMGFAKLVSDFLN